MTFKKSAYWWKHILGLPVGSWQRTLAAATAPLMTSIESIRRFTECGTKAWSKSELGAKSLIGIWSNKVQATKLPDPLQSVHLPANQIRLHVVLITN
jgi:hypothetical protein